MQLLCGCAHHLPERSEHDLNGPKMSPYSRNIAKLGIMLDAVDTPSTG
jgi:hypothetical protein